VTVAETVNSEFMIDLLAEILTLNLVGKLLYEYPDKDWYQSLFDSETFEEIPFGGQRQETQSGLALINSWINENYREAHKDWFEELRADYTRLFIGPDQVLAPPWESVFVKEGRLIFTETTLAVRNWYRQFGLVQEKLYTEPDDHIGLELAFLAHLTGQAVEALESDTPEKSREWLAAKRGFCEAHFARWADVYFDQLYDYSRTDFYRGLARLGKGTFLEILYVLDIPVQKEAKS
jgi:TorA maturation chaperone TorD